MSIAFVTAILAGCSTPPAAAPQSSDTTAGKPAVDVVELSATDARDRMASGSLTSRELTQAYLDRIAKIDDAGPLLNAVIELNPSALEDAAALDAERKAGKPRGPLHGIPILIKDNVDVAGMVNSAGSLAMVENRPTQDAFIAARLRASGAVILGKANLSEGANFRSTRSSSGWSSRGGQTKNPSVSQDTAGPMGRSVADVALLLNGLAGVDDSDPSGPAAAGQIATDYTAFLEADAIKGKRFGVVRQAMGYHPDVDASMVTAIAAITAGGAEVIDVKVPTFRRTSPSRR